jgi:C-terminal peptidase prc
MRASSISRALALIVLLALAVPPRTDAQVEPASCEVVGQNLFVRDVLTDLYLWYDQLPDLDPARFDSPEAYLEAVRYRPLDSTFSYITSRAESDAFFDESQYIGLGLSTTTTGNEMRVQQVFDGSPAAEAGLERGDRILEIDGRSIASLVASGRIGTAFGASTVGTRVQLAYERRAGGRARRTLTKRVVTIPTVSLTRVLDVGGRRVGYIFFRNFVRPSFDALDEAFRALREGGATELVLDLRYNGGGLVDVAVHLGNLIGGSLTDGQVFATYAHNDKNEFRNETLRFEPNPNALRLSRLFVLTTRASASASELVINSLRPYLPVFVIGSATYGKPVGQYGIPFCDKLVAPVAFSLPNTNGEADYFGGLAPSCSAADDVGHDLGDVEEASLAEALHVVREGTCSAGSSLTARTLARPDTPPQARGWDVVVNAY